MMTLIWVPKLLIQPILWRFVGFASSVVGLLCYALSSSFTCLFGNWNLLKIIIYSVVSLTICSIMLFAKKWNLSRSFLLKSQLVFLVLMLTSFYSFFYDKALNGSKPDVLSLISCVSFAVMSFILSRQTELGFDVDLLNFFLGCVILQLMKINLMLALVGAAFSYTLIILRFCLDSQMETGNVSVTNHLAIDIIDSGNGGDYSSHRQELQSLRRTSDDVKECSHVYNSCRRKFLEESFLRLGMRKLSIEDVHKMSWCELQKEIKIWIKASKEALRILFPSERRLCDREFFGFPSASDLSFMEICRDWTIQLLNFAYAVATGSRAPARLIRILDMFEAMSDLIPEFESLFPDHYCVFLRNEALTICKRLGEAIRDTITEVEIVLRRDLEGPVVFVDGIHPVTRCVANYLLAACKYRQTLEQVFEDNGKEYQKLDDRVASSSSLSVQMASIMEVLESNLEAKAKIYMDPALSSVFMMNNGRYIVQKAKNSELGTLLGDDWIRKHNAKVRKYHVNYQRRSWNEVLSLLKPDNGSSDAPNAAKTMEEKLKLFNTQFEEICRVQSTWFVFDEQLREEIRISLKKILLPAYRNFIVRFQNLPEMGKHADKYSRYPVEEVEASVDGLFVFKEFVSQ